VTLFEEVAARGIITAGRGEQEASDRIRDLANEMFGKTRHWHKRIVRSGPHTLFPYRENPPDRVIEADDIAFADFGPIFDEFEADLGRTYVLGDDPVKPPARGRPPGHLRRGRRYFASHPDITGAELYAEVARLAREAGWSFGNTHAGHLVGEFPHETIDGARLESYIARATPRRCAAPTRPGGSATGSWRSTSPTPRADSAASTSSFSTSADAGQRSGGMASARPSPW